jgi:cell division protein FtsQ
MKSTVRRHSPSASGQGWADALNTLQRWLARLLVAASTLCVIWLGGRAVLYLQALPVRHIEVIGAIENTSAATIQKRVANGLAGGFLGSDLVALQEDLEALPWVYRATIRRRWPDTLEITISEQRPIARWNEGGFLNHEGQQFSAPAQDKWFALPLLVGPEGTQQMLMQRYLRLDELLRGTGLVVMAFRQDAVRQLTVEFANGLTLVLGDDAFVQRLRRFRHLYLHELQAQPVAVIDMRYAHGAAVRFHAEQFASAVDINRGGKHGGE